MSKKLILIASPFAFKNEHITFDLGFLLLSKNWDNANIIFFGEKEHIQNLRILLGDSRGIKFIAFNRIFGKFLFGYIVTAYVFIYNTIYKNTRVIFLSFENPHLIICIGLFFRNSIGFLHRKKGTNHLFTFIKKIGYKFFIKNNHVIVLGEWIYEKLTPNINLSWIYHPVLLPNKNRLTQTRGNKTICFFIDRNHISQALKIKEMIFHLGDFEVLEVFGNLQLSDKEYFSILEKSKYCVFLEDTSKYNYICSGRFFDILSYGIIPFAISSSMTFNLSNKLGKIGYFFNDFDSLFKGLQRILCSKQKDDITLSQNIFKIDQQIFNLNSAKITKLL